MQSRLKRSFYKVEKVFDSSLKAEEIARRAGVCRETVMQYVAAYGLVIYPKEDRERDELFERLYDKGMSVSELVRLSNQSRHHATVWHKKRQLLPNRKHEKLEKKYLPGMSTRRLAGLTGFAYGYVYQWMLKNGHAKVFISDKIKTNKKKNNTYK